MSQVHAVSQAVRPMSLADSGDPGGPGPGQHRGEVDGVGLSPIGAWPWTMKSLIIDGHSFFGAAARERHRRACWHRHQARLR